MKSIADDVFRSFIFRLHRQKLEEAYALKSPVFQAENPYAEWASIEQEFHSLHGGGMRYSGVLSTWYEVGAQGERPGNYVNLQYSCNADTFSECSGVMVLYSADQEEFLIDSHKRTYKLISVLPEASAPAENDHH
jgi:hypothetical protein